MMLRAVVAQCQKQMDWGDSDQSLPKVPEGPSLPVAADTAQLQVAMGLLIF